MFCIRPILGYQSKSTWFNVIILKKCQGLLSQFVVEAGHTVMELLHKTQQGWRNKTERVQGGGGERERGGQEGGRETVRDREVRERCRKGSESGEERERGRKKRG